MGTERGNERGTWAGTGGERGHLGPNWERAGERNRVRGNWGTGTWERVVELNWELNVRNWVELGSGTWVTGTGERVRELGTELGTQRNRGNQELNWGQVELGGGNAQNWELKVGWELGTRTNKCW